MDNPVLKGKCILWEIPYLILFIYFLVCLFFYGILQKRNCLIEQQDLLYITEICNLFSLVQIFVIVDQMQFFLSHVRLQILITQNCVKLKRDCPVYMCKCSICKEDKVKSVSYSYVCFSYETVISCVNLWFVNRTLHQPFHANLHLFLKSKNLVSSCKNTVQLGICGVNISTMCCFFSC